MVLLFSVRKNYNAYNERIVNVNLDYEDIAVKNLDYEDT